MIFIILIILEIICIIPLTILWLKTEHNKIPEDIHGTIIAGFIITASVINWFCFGAYTSGLIISPSNGFFEGDLNIIGLAIAILPPVLAEITAYILFLIIDHIKFEIFLAKERNEREKN